MEYIYPGRSQTSRSIISNSTATNKHIVLLSDGVPTYSYGFNSTQVRRAGYRTEYVSNGELPDGYTAGRYNVTGTSYNSSAYSTIAVLVTAGPCITRLIMNITMEEDHYIITATVP